MKKFLQSKITAWLAFLLVIVVLALTFKMRTPWWAFIDIFFLFMASFIFLIAVYIKKVNIPVANTLYNCSFIFGILWVLAFIGEWIAFQYIV